MPIGSSKWFQDNIGYIILGVVTLVVSFVVSLAIITIFWSN